MAANAEGQQEQKKPSARADSSGSWLSNIGTWPSQTKTFLGDVRAETQRVTWPTRKSIRATTIVVLVTVFFFGLYFAVLDYVFANAIGRLLQWGS